MYEDYSDKLDFSDHKRAAMEYAGIGKKKLAQEAIRRCAKTWWPIEVHQIEPVELLIDPALIPIMDRKLCAEILKMPKGPDTV